MDTRTVGLIVALTVGLLGTSVGASASSQSGRIDPLAKKSIRGAAQAAERPPNLPTPRPMQEAGQGSDAVKLGQLRTEGLSRGTRSLISELTGRKISSQRAGQIALSKLNGVRGVGTGANVPSKYADRSLTQTDINALSSAYKLVSAQMPAKERARQAQTLKQSRELTSAKSSNVRVVQGSGASVASATPSEYLCAEVYVGEMRCRVIYPHFTVLWRYPKDQPQPTFMTPTVAGIPEGVSKLAEGLEGSRATYSSLGFEVPSVQVHVEITDGVPTGASWPYDDQISVNPGSLNEYIGAHEFFHQVQYEYSKNIWVADANWFQEASAEWAAQAYLTDSNGGSPPSDVRYAAGIPTFLSTADHDLLERDGYGGVRQYGAVSFVDYMNQRLDGNQEGAFVERVLLAFSNQLAGADVKSALRTTFEDDYYTSIEAELGWFWRVMSTQCVDAENPGGDFAAVAAAWCPGLEASSLLDVGRPQATSLQQLAAGSGEVLGKPVGRGGAIYVDVLGAAGQTERKLTVSASLAGGASGEVRVTSWVGRPGGSAPKPPGWETWYDGWWPPCVIDESSPIGPSGQATLTVRIPADCPNVTIMVVNTDLGSTGTANLNWASWPVDTLISNGVLQLGVRDSGQVGTTQLGAPLSHYPWANVGLREIASNADLFSGFENAGGVVAVRRADGSVFTLNGNEWMFSPGESGGAVTSFVTDSSTARSRVSAGGYTLEHYYHPDANDNKVYVCDVSLEGLQAGDTAIYRRGWNPRPDPGPSYSTSAEIIASGGSGTGALLTRLSNLGTGELEDPSNAWGPSWMKLAPFSDLIDWTGDPQIDAIMQDPSRTHFSLIYATGASVSEVKQRLSQHGAQGQITVESGESDPEGTILLTQDPIVFGIGFAGGPSSAH